jgi:parallel beta-helix repeat protein
MKKIFLIISLAILTLILGGCPDVLSEKPNSARPTPGTENEIPKGFGALRVNVTLGNARTALPAELKLDTLSYEYSFFDKDRVKLNQQPEKRSENNGNAVFILAPGQYLLEIKAFVTIDDDEVPVAEGYVGNDTTISIKIENKITTPVSVDLRPIAEGTGTLSFTVTYTGTDSTVLVTTFTLTNLFPPGEIIHLEDDGDPPVTPIGPKLYTKSDIPSGYYRLLVVLQNMDNNKRASKSEVVHIYQNLTTKKDYVFTDADFASDLFVTTANNDGAGSLRYAVDNADNGRVIRIMLDPGSEIKLESSLEITKDITIENIGGEVTITRADASFKESLFTINGGRTLTLGSENDIVPTPIIIDGGSKNALSPITATAALITVNGQLFMYDGVTLQNNKNTESEGGGVYVFCGTFTMNGGIISGNESNAYGGGVYVWGQPGSLATFFMKKGTISGNTVSNNGGGVCVQDNGQFEMTGGTIGGTKPEDKNIAGYNGGGVFVTYGSTFTMYNENTMICGNEAKAPNGGGGGVYLFGGTFTMYNGIINGNNALEGGGVYVLSASGYTGNFTMEGGIIGTTDPYENGNTAQNGGGVYMSANGPYGAIFTMEKNARISGNTASECGGGVYVNNIGTFNMEGGTINGNTATTANGGGVFVGGGTFTMSDGTIGGGNTASNGGGVFVEGGTFTMKSGTISGNYASSKGGGGVCVLEGTFQMAGGTIYGLDDEINTNNYNKYNDSARGGAALYVFESGGGTAQYGILNTDGTGFAEVKGTLTKVENTIKVVNGIRTFYVANKDQWDTACGEIKNGDVGNYYDINVTGNIGIDGITDDLTFGYFEDINVTIRGSGTLTLNSEGSLLNIDNGHKVTIENINLMGRGLYSGDENNTALVNVYDGEFTMSGGKISGNNNPEYDYPGGGVNVGTSGSFIMKDGAEVFGNKAFYGGGVYVRGTFTMYNGSIYGNTATGDGDMVGGDGGGVYVDGGTFQISNGTVYGNDEDTSVNNTAANDGKGAALYVWDSGTAEYGTGNSWTSFSLSGNNSKYTDKTIEVEDGALKQ